MKWKILFKILKSLEDSGVLLKEVTETVQNEIKKQKGGFLSMLLGTLGESLLENILTGRGINRAEKGRGINRAGEGIVRAGYGNNKKGVKKKKQLKRFLMPSYVLTNFCLQKCYQIDPRFNGVYSRDNLPKTKDGAYVTNLDDYSVIGTHWVALHVRCTNVTYFDSFDI